VSKLNDISTKHRLPQNFLNSIKPNMRRVNSNLGSIILGYDENISTEMCAFIETLTEHYDTTQRGQRFTQINDRLWQQFVRVLEGHPLILDEDRELFRRIINSHTFKALIFCFINHYMIPGSHAEKKESLVLFYTLITAYFGEQNGCFELVNMEKVLKYEAQGKIYYRSYIPLIKIIMKINICSYTAFERIRPKTKEKPLKLIDEPRLFAMFQETIAAKSFDIASELTCSYVCNLPGCGDYISFFKGIKKYVLFTECKLQEDRATAALMELDSKAGVNVKYTDRNSVQRFGLIGKVNTTIKGRFLASYIDSYSKYKESGKNIHEFTLGILELSTNKSIRKIEMKVLITKDILRELNHFISAQCFFPDQFTRRFDLRSTFPQKRPHKAITNNVFDPEYMEVPIVDLSIPDQFTMSRMLDIWLTTMDIDKAYSGITTTLPISNNKSLAKLRLKRFEKDFLEPKTSNRDSWCRWAAVTEEEQSLKDLFCLMKSESNLTENERNKMKRKINKIFVKYAGDPEYFEQPMQGEKNNSQNFVVAPAFPLETDPARRHIYGYQTFEKRRGYVVRYHPRRKDYFYIAKPKRGFKLMFDITLMEFVHVPKNWRRSDLSKCHMHKSYPDIIGRSDSGERIVPPNYNGENALYGFEAENCVAVPNGVVAVPGAADVRARTGAAASNDVRAPPGNPILRRVPYNQ
jgi:hypothetical protein